MGDPRTQGTRWLYLPTVVIRVPEWLRDDVVAYCHKREADRLRAAQNATKNARKSTKKPPKGRRK